ncbi:MAG: LysR family transcriptional regulator [Ruminococcaceae bacterium]|nr:LysR family transcriptional regulator [Oscillospiraceae bacterium]
MEQALRAVLSIRLFTDRKCFGPGIAELLHRVEEHHSLRAAAQSMEMAYSKAWTITKNAEAGLGVKLLSSSTGGRNGGGAELTDEARRILEAYDRYCEKLRAYGDELLASEFAFLQDLCSFDNSN